VVNEPVLPRLPVVINTAFAEQFKGRSISNDPLKVGDERNLILNLGTGSVELGYVVVGVIDQLPSVNVKDPMLITELSLVRPVINQAGSSLSFFDQNEIWLDLPDREPSGKLEDEIAGLTGVNNVVWAWDRYGEIQREPLPSAVAGMLYAGFWISLLLSLLDFAFYLIVTARQRLFTFGVLRSLGWNSGHIWRLLFIEQVALIAPALIIGSLIGMGLAYLLLPFLALVGSESLRMPWLQLAGMLAILVFSFTALMGMAAIFLRRMSVNQVLRLGEE
jgi:ABC-type antimicrobial peptide transport system permease subunit